MPIPVGYKETILTPQMSRTVEARWTFMTDRSGSALVLPDGRCDIILRYSIHDTKRPLPIVTGPATQAYWVPYIKGECWIGMRLRPECGAWIWKDKIDQAADAVLRGERTYSLLPAIRMYACRQALLDNFFGMVKNIQEGQPNRRLCEAVKLLHVSGGRICLENLADMKQCTARHLNRLFCANVGLTAKNLCAIGTVPSRREISANGTCIAYRCSS